MVFQDPRSAFTPVHRVGDQIAETVRIHTGLSKKAAARRAAELLDLVGLPGSPRPVRAFPHELSGGMCQRALIAMAIANDPAVIVADEPTSALDVTVQAQILDVLKGARVETGAAVVLITHDLGIVAGFADQVMVMRAGRPVEAGPVGDVYHRPRLPYTMGLLRCVPRLDESPQAQAQAQAQARVHRAGPAPVLQVDGLVKHYPLRKGPVFRRRVGAVRAVDGIGFDVRAGETLGLVGESGCGKTTALMEILRLGPTQAGRVVVLGGHTAKLRAAGRKALRRDVQVVFQDPLASLDPHLPVGAILAEPLRIHGHAGKDVAGRVRELLGLVGLEPAHASRHPGDLSGGQRQRVAIARALALRPRLLVMDEPVSALDVCTQAGIIELLGELKARLGTAYLIAAHDLAVVRRLADRVAVMHLGRIAEAGDAGAVYGTPAHPYTRALLSAVPLPDPRGERERRPILLRGDPPSPSEPPPGCRFHTRCPTFAVLGDAERRRCAAEDPVMRPAGVDHAVACHYPESGP
jgi:peptide/nickel transport system ATP-binding protein